MKLIGSCDPGKTGAISVIDENLNVIALVDMPKDNKTFVDFIQNVRYRCDKVYLENVHALPRQSTVAGFSFGSSFGKAELICTAMGDVVKVTPQSWKKYFGLLRVDGETKTQFKHRSIEVAKKLFPSISSELKASKSDRAEALLIAYFGLQR